MKFFDIFKKEKFMGENLIKISFLEVSTMGNHSYIRIEETFIRPHDIHKKILYTLDRFEKEKNVEITNWFIEKTFTFDKSRTYLLTEVNGLWITHRPNPE